MACLKFIMYFLAATMSVVMTICVLFTFNSPTCIPKNDMRMSSTDMRLANPESTFWCEALKLSSEHPFLAFQLSRKPKISQESLLSRNEVYLNLDLDISDIRQVQYFLLQGTMVTAVMCATHPGATFYALRERDFEKKVKRMSTTSDCDQNSEWNPSYYSSKGKPSVTRITATTALKVQDIPARNIDDTDCLFTSKSQLLQLNITSTGSYFLMVHYKGPALRNFVKIRLFLDRTSYDVTGYVRAVHVCTGSSFGSSCDIPLNFLSNDRVLVKIPGEPGAGLTTFNVRSSCKPRFIIHKSFGSLILCPLFSISLVVLVIYTVRIIALLLRHRRLTSYRLRPTSKTTCERLVMESDEDEEGDDIEQIVVNLTTKPGIINEVQQEVKLHVEFLAAVSCDGYQDAQKIADDQPPCYHNLVFNPEVDE